jgi:YD repeat-containing protein
MIGGGEFPEGLTFDREYLSSLDSLFSTDFRAQGWNNNLVATITNQIIPNPFNQPPPGHEKWLYHVTIGGRSVGFVGGSPPITGRFPGTYEPVHFDGTTLVFEGSQNDGHFTFTDRDGTVLYFNSLMEGLRVRTWTAPDGTKLDFTYDGDRLRSVFSTRGYALLFEHSATTTNLTKACAVNLARTYVTPVSTCPADAQTVSYSYISSTWRPSTQLMTGATDATGQTTSYSYVGTDHLTCITLPGQSTCQIANTYNFCHRTPTLNQDPVDLHLMDQVVSQVLASGETYSYSFPANPECPDPTPNSNQIVMTASGVATTTVTTNGAGMPTAITDAINRTAGMAYNANGRLLTELTQIRSQTRPEGDAVEFEYDSRGNIIERRMIARPGSPLANIVAHAGFPPTCVNPKTCNEADYTTDANQNRTDFTYDPAHGGVLTETGPAANGIRPQSRHVYAQRRAWILGSTGGYVQVSTPVWVRTATSLCRNSAATGNPAAPCATAGDEVRTEYDYGPDSGPNNLLLRGQTVTSTDGGVTTTLRSCYGYDRDGRLISETQPNANLASCP